MLFVPAAEAASEIPAWIKNNAGWWADGQIDDASFLNGIEYLIDNSILKIQTNQKSNENGMIQLEKLLYEVPTGNKIIKVNAFAKFENLSMSHSGSPSSSVSTASVQVTRPDGKIDSENIRITSGVLNYAYKIKSDFPVGDYEISVKGTNNILLEPISFKLQAKSAEEKAIPAWVKNMAGWWASDKIPEENFVLGLQFLVKEGIIKVKQVDTTFGTGINSELLVYQTKILPSQEPYTVTVIYTTQNDSCTSEEEKKAIAYAKMSEILINKNLRKNITQVTAVCMELHEIKADTYPLVMKEIGLDFASVMIFVGGLEANFESYYDKSAVAWWQCNWQYSYGTAGMTGWQCMPSQIIICEDCRRVNPLWDGAVRDRDFDDAIDRGMWFLSHEIAHQNIYEETQKRDAWVTAVHDNQYAFDLCYAFDIVENKLCKKLYTKEKVMGEIYTVMDINYVKSNWREEGISDLKNEIVSIVGTGSEIEGFSKYKLIDVDFEEAKENPTKEVEETVVLSIEYPDDWEDGYYKFDWSIWDYQEDLKAYQKDMGLPEDDESLECCDIFQADKATLRVAGNLWKDDTRTTGAIYPWKYLATLQVWFLDNVHYGGATDEERFDALVDARWKECSNYSFRVDQLECKNFKVLEKSIYVTDEGRKAYSLLTSYDIKWVKYSMDNKIGTTTEVYVGEDAWQVWTEFDQDLYEYSRDVVDRFNSSLVLFDTTYPIPSDPVIPKKIVTEDGIQYKANRAWEDAPVWDNTNYSDIEKETKISKYKVICDTDCNITLNENMKIGEIVTKTWEGTELERAQWDYNDNWWAEEVDCTDANERLTQVYEEETGFILNVSLCEWDEENQEWIIPKVDKWLYETVDLKKFQDDVLHEQIWDIYKSMTPKQIVEEIDTFLISTDDRGGFAAFIARCIDEDDYGCGSPGVPNTKFVVSFDPLDFAPTGGERQAMYQPGKIKDALEINMLKSILIHENAHILSLSASQSDNDLLGWEQFPYNEDLEKADFVKVEQIFTQKEADCAPNVYADWSGCMKDNSYLNLFFQKFWADIYSEYHYWFEFSDDKKKLSELVSAFRQNYGDRFVTHYAMTNPTEDFAESFTAFVLWDEEVISNHKKLCSEKKGQWGLASGWNMIQDGDWSYWHLCDKVYSYNAIWEEKIRFFYDFPELVEMRDFIRSNL